MDIKAILIDDEVHGIEMLKVLLHHCAPNVHIHGFASNHADAFKLVQNVKPDLIFLDIEMPEGSGFDFLDKLEGFNGEIIFTTAYSQYAIKAFKYNATDYLLKPIVSEELITAIAKAETKIKEKLQQPAKPFVTLSSHAVNKIGVPTADGISFIDVNEIIKCVARENYTELFLKEGKPLMVSRTLKEFEEVLDSHQFFRIHNSYLVNIMFIKKYAKAGYVVLADDSIVEVSKRKKNAFLERLSVVKR
jgi:two-component system LytT family response regulator